MANKSSKDKQSIANRTYQYSDYYTKDQTSKGLAETHEQVSDTYMEGTVDQEVNPTNHHGDSQNAESLRRDSSK